MKAVGEGEREGRRDGGVKERSGICVGEKWKGTVVQQRKKASSEHL